MMTTETKLWPIDFDALVQGSRISSPVIEVFCERKKEHPEYRLRGQLQIMDMVRRMRPELDPYVRCHGFDVIIMDYAEASRYREAQSDKSLRGFVSAYGRNTAVDATKLEDSELVRHDAALYRHGRYASALAQTKQSLSLEAVKSTKPRLDDK
jgi:hypothetical protein